MASSRSESGGFVEPQGAFEPSSWVRDIFVPISMRHGKIPRGGSHRSRDREGAVVGVRNNRSLPVAAPVAAAPPVARIWRSGAI